MSATSQADYFSSQVVRTRRFFRPEWSKTKGQAGRPSLVAGGCEWCAPDFVIERHRFPYVAFELVSKGRGYVTLSGVENPVSAGHAFFFDPSTPHIIRSDTEDPMVKYFFNLTGNNAADLLSELGLVPGTVIRVLDVARIVSLLEEVLDHALRGGPLAFRSATVALEHALVLCADGRQPAEDHLAPAYATYLRCRNHLLRNYTLLSSIEEAAGNCHVSPAYFTRLFQRFDTETPLTCLTRLKLSQAILLLREPDRQVKAVADALHYKSAAHFSRAFKAWHQRTPQSVMRESLPSTVRPGMTKP